MTTREQLCGGCLTGVGHTKADHHAGEGGPCTICACLHFKPLQKQTVWRCGRCEQLELKERGFEVGEMIPEHHRTCQLRDLADPEPTAPDDERCEEAKDSLRCLRVTGHDEAHIADARYLTWTAT